MNPKVMIAAFMITCAYSACTNTKTDGKKDETTLMDKVISVHDKVMGKSETIMKYKTSLDSVIKTSTDTVKKRTAVVLKSQLGMADEAMETWMHQFNPDFTGKTHPEVMSYLKTQQNQINRVDSLLNISLYNSGKFLKAR